MIPYFQYNTIVFGPLTLQVWGLWVSLGFVVAAVLAYQLAKRYVLSEQVMLDLAVWSVVGGFIGARAFHILFYEPAYYYQYPGELLKFWHGGASSLGGFFGAAVAVYLFSKVRHFTFKELLPYFDIGFLSFWLGWAIGRLGCFFIHDHPGRLTNSFLAVNFPSGPRFDLGFLEVIISAGVFIITALLFKYLIKKGWGHVAGYSLALYAVARFFLDFLRATDLPFSDPRYAGLTPAQWGMTSILAVLTMLLIWRKIGKQKINGEVAYSP